MTIINDRRTVPELERECPARNLLATSLALSQEMRL